MGLIDHVRRRWRRTDSTDISPAPGVGRLVPWGGLGLGAAAVIGLIALVLVVAWVLGPDDTETRKLSEVVAGVPLPNAAPAAPVAATGGEPLRDPAAEAVVRPGLGLGVPAMPSDAFDAVPAAAIVQPLAEAPIAELMEPVAGQMLPRIGADGGRAWKVYARPFDRKDDRPRVALIIGGLGLSQSATQASIERLPGAVSLAFDPYAEETAMWTRRARRNGHETLATLPLQPADFPFHDLGPLTLQVAAQPAANMQRLSDLLAGAPGAVGVMAIGGGAFNRSAEAAAPILKAIGRRGLMVADATTPSDESLVALSAKLDVPHLHVDITLDDVPDAAAIDRQLDRLLEIARERLVAVGLGRPLPVTFARIQAWAGQLDAAGVVLAPATAVVGTQFGNP